MDLQSMLSASRPFVSGIVGRAGSLLKGASRIPMADPIQNSPKMRLDMTDMLMKPQNGGDGNMPNVDYSRIGGASPMDLLKAAMAGKQPGAPPYASPFDEAGFMPPPAQAPASAAPAAAPVPMPQPRPPQAPQASAMMPMDFQDQMMDGPSPLGKFGMFDAPGKQLNTLASFLKMFG